MCSLPKHRRTKIFTVRKARETDIDAIFSLIQAKGRLDGSTKALQSERLDIKRALFSASPKVYALVAETDGLVVGMATYCQIYSTFFNRPGLWLDDVYVYPEHRKQGMAKAMLACLCSVALEMGCTQIDSSIANDLASEHKLTRAIGAQIFHERRLIRLDESGMKKLAQQAKAIGFGEGSSSTGGAAQQPK